MFLEVRARLLVPSLDYIKLIPRLEKRLISDEYLQILEDVDALDIEPYVSYTIARQEVRELEGEPKIIKWIAYHLLEPKFDNPDAQMPNLKLSNRQAKIIARYLTTDPNIQSESTTTNEQQAQNSAEDASSSGEENELSFFSNIVASLPPLRYRHLPLVFLSGVLLAIFFMRIFRK